MSRWGTVGAWQGGSMSSDRSHFSQTRTSRALTQPFSLESSTGSGHLTPLGGSYRTWVKTGIVKSCQISYLNLSIKKHGPCESFPKLQASQGPLPAKAEQERAPGPQKSPYTQPRTPKFCLHTVSRQSSLKCCFRSFPVLLP